MKDKEHCECGSEMNYEEKIELGCCQKCYEKYLKDKYPRHPDDKGRRGNE